MSHSENSQLQIQRKRENRIREMKKFSNSIPQNLRGYKVMELLDGNSDYDKLSKAGKSSLRKYLENPTLFLLLGGGSGLGKTVVASGICFELLRRGWGVTAKYAEVSSLLNKFSFGDGDKSPNEVLQDMVKPDVLLLDDIGAGTAAATSTRKNSMHSLISQRWDQDKLTVMTTNLAISKSVGSRNDSESIQEWFGDAAWDRIAGRASSGDTNLTRVNFRGSTMRGSSTRNRG